MWIDLPEWAKDEKIFVSQVNAHYKVTSTEEYLKNQVCRVIHSVDTSQTLSLAKPVITQWAQEQSGHGGKEGGHMGAQ